MEYQAIYDAVRRQIPYCDVNAAVERAFDISHQKARLQEAIYSVSDEMRRPSVMYRPSIFKDGYLWCALYGDDLQSGVAGFGQSPALAMADFDKNWFAEIHTMQPIKESA